MKSICLRSLLNLAAVVSFAFALAVPTRAIADVIALKIPGIQGDLKEVGFENQIEVMSLSNNILNPEKYHQAEEVELTRQFLAI